MQCANLLKRRGLEDEGAELRSCAAKRRCLEAELPVAACPMETSVSVAVTNQQQEQQVGVNQPRPPLCCPRCLGGEPGHINHILGH